MGDNRDSNGIFQKILQQIDKDKSIKFIVNNGDLVDNGKSYQFKNYVNIIKQFDIPILHAIGNHDISFFCFFNCYENYEKYIGKRYYAFSYLNSYFIILDNANKKNFDSKEIIWLKKELKKAKKYKFRFVFFHVPLYDPSKGFMKKGHSLKDLKSAKQINNLLDKYKVSMIFASHLHRFFEGKWQKTPFIVTGGAGAPQDFYENKFFHYIKVTVYKDKVLYKVIKLKN
jgi:3',5'-cyclic AMP phosphodiesterase CpdA